MTKKKLFYCNFPGVWLTGSAVIKAETKEEAEQMLHDELVKRHIFNSLADNPLDAIEIKRNEQLIILQDGDY